MHRCFTWLLLASSIAVQSVDAAGPALAGKVEGGVYTAPGGAFRLPVPVLPELGGTIVDTENVVTFQDAFNTHISIAAFPQNDAQKFELSSRGPKDYLTYFFTTFILPDFIQRFPNTRVEKAVFLPGVQDGALLAFILLPGGSMFGERVAIVPGAAKSAVAKRGNLLFVKAGRVFVISMELAERVLETPGHHKSPEEENETLRERLLNLAARIEFGPLSQPAASPL